MRVVRLLLVCLLVYAGTMLWLFPAAPVVERIKPMIQPVELTGVDGRVLGGSVQQVSYDDGVLPLELQNVSWRLAPQKLLTGAAGVKVAFEAYGGRGSGLVAQRYNGDVDVTDTVFAGPAKGFEALLPLPIAQFAGQFRADIESIAIRNQLLKSFRGQINWADAVLEQPIRAQFGNINLDIKPIDEETHRGFIKASGGELDVEGSVDLKQNGDFKTDITVTPSSGATPELLSALRGLGRPDQSGRYRIRRNGNVNRLM